MNSPLWNRVTVVGCGLIGASFALALKRNNLCTRIAGWDTSESVLAEALRKGVIDEVDRTFTTGGISASDLIYLALPVNFIIAFLKERGFAIKSGALVTDAGSTKHRICAAAREHLPRDCVFVGGHPIAGSHLSGIEHARSDLFAGQAYVLVAHETGVPGAALTALMETIAKVGARVVLMTAREHDHAMAFVSHLPQLLSNALAATIRSKPDVERMLDVAGSGYCDMTRLALSSWSIWKDVLITNDLEIEDALGEFMKELEFVRDELRSVHQSSNPELLHTRSLFEQT